MRILKIAAAALILGASGATAATVYNNPFIAGGAGFETTEYVQANTFSVAADTDVLGGSVAIAGLGNINAWDRTFNYWFFDDAGGLPGTTLNSGTIDYSSAAVYNSNVTDTGVAWGFGGNIFTIDFNLNSVFSALSGVQYWLGIQLSSDFARDDIYWVHSTAPTGNAESQLGTFDNWGAYSPGLAFSLEGIDTISVVPLPAGGVLLLTGLGGMFFARRRKHA